MPDSRRTKTLQSPERIELIHAVLDGLMRIEDGVDPFETEAAPKKKGAPLERSDVARFVASVTERCGPEGAGPPDPLRATKLHSQIKAARNKSFPRFGNWRDVYDKFKHPNTFVSVIEGCLAKDDTLTRLETLLAIPAGSYGNVRVRHPARVWLTSDLLADIQKAALFPIHTEPPPTQGREWMFGLLDRAVAGRDSKIVSVVGPHGYGKSTALAAWMRRPTPARIVAAHFFYGPEPPSLHAVPFLKAMVRQLLGAGIPGYPEALQEAARRQKGQAWGTKPASLLFRWFVVEPLQTLPAPKANVAIVLDGLDEALAASRLSKPFESVVDVSILLHAMEDLPDWVRVVVATQPDPDLKLSGSQPILVDAYSKEHHRDLRDYLQTTVRAYQSKGELVGLDPAAAAEDFIARIDNDTFLAVVEAARFPGSFQGGAIPGIDAHYERYFESHIGPDEFKRVFAPILEILQAAGEPIAADFVAAALRSRPDEVETCLARLESYVERNAQARYSLRLSDFSGWLQSEANGRYAAQSERGRASINGWADARVGSAPPEAVAFFEALCALSGTWGLAEAEALYDGEAGPLKARLRMRLTLFAEASLLQREGADRWSIVFGLREWGIRRLWASGRHGGVNERIERLLQERLRVWGERPLDDILRKPQASVAPVLADVERMRRVFASLDEVPRMVLALQSLVQGLFYNVWRAFPSSLFLDFKSLRAEIIVCRGIYHYTRGHYEETLREADNALARPDIDPWIRASALATQALAKTFLGIPVDLERALSTILERFSAPGGGSIDTKRYWNAMSHVQIATAWWQCMRKARPALRTEAGAPQLHRSIDLYWEAYLELEEIRDFVFRAYALNSLGHLFRLRSATAPGDRAYSFEFYSTSLRISREIGNNRGILGVIHGTAGWLFWRGETYAFVELMTEVEALYIAINQKMPLPIRTEYDLMWVEAGGKPVLPTIKRPVERLVSLADQAEKRLSDWARDEARDFELSGTHVDDTNLGTPLEKPHSGA